MFVLFFWILVEPLSVDLPVYNNVLKYRVTYFLSIHHLSTDIRRCKLEIMIL